MKSKLEVRHALWRRGILSWKLDKVQKELYNLFYNSNHKIQTWLLSRRSGKTYALVTIANEQCIRHPNSIVKIVAPTKLQINTILRPLFKQILKDCPEDIKPEFKAKDYIYYFPNGSEIQLAGTDSKHAEKLRGGDSHIAFVDEAGSCSELDYVLKSILLPTTLVTKGKIVLASTPPQESEHDFLKYIEEAEFRGSLVKKTIDDNPRISLEEKNQLIEELGGINSDACQRELYCKIIQDSNLSVIPEFTDDLCKEIIRNWDKPPFSDRYVAMDLGFKDLTVVLFGYFDFKSDKIIIEDELAIDFSDSNNNLPTLINGIKQKEMELWFNSLTNEVQKPYTRVSDINYIVTQEIARSSKGEIVFAPAKKDDKDAALNTLRAMLGSKKIIINPKCKTLIRHLKNVRWSSAINRHTFARSIDNGHFDAVDALIYFVRSISYGKNPYPATYHMNLRDLHVQNPSSFYNKINQVDIFKQIFKIKGKTHG